MATTILVVEDDRIIAAGIARQLVSMGYAIAGAAHTGATAVAMALELRPDLILMDISLGAGIDGAEAASRIVAQLDVPIVYLTANTDDAVLQRVQLTNPLGYVMKPYEESELRTAIEIGLYRNRMERRLRESEQWLAAILGSIGDGVIATDQQGCVSYMNLRAGELTGWRPQDAVGKPVEEVFHIVNEFTREVVRNPALESLEKGGATSLAPNTILIDTAGIERPIGDSSAPIRDLSGTPFGAVLVFRDVTAAHALARQMTHAAQHDLLTGLPNRLLLQDRVRQAIAMAARRQTFVVLLFLDLDGFKQINDTRGHAVGDQLLQSIATRLGRCIRDSDTVSRLGGDEFIILLADVQHMEDASIAAARILQAVDQAHPSDHQGLHVTASIGVSLYPGDGTDAEMLIKNADTAMYQAKGQGPGRYQFFKSGMNAQALERQSIGAELRRAFDGQQLWLEYQPQVTLATGRISGAEAIVRWRHAALDPLPPPQLMSVAEDFGLLVPIGNWLLHEACRQGATWISAGLALTAISVSVSARQFRQNNFVPAIRAVLADTGLDARYLELEMTEDVLMARPDSTDIILKTLREAGVRLAIKDFGIGYSSLTCLARFPVTTVNIDRSLVRHVNADPGRARVVAGIVGMSRGLGLRVVAHGVEDAEELACLKSHGCDEAQGAYLGGPVAAEAFGVVMTKQLQSTRNV